MDQTLYHFRGLAIIGHLNSVRQWNSKGKIQNIFVNKRLEENSLEKTKTDLQAVRVHAASPVS